MNHDYLYKTIPPLDEYKIWMSDQVEPLIDSPAPFPPWFTKGNPECTTDYVLNNIGLRCDDITEVKPENHILFSGCEITLPQGVDLDKGWANLVYKELVPDGKDFRNLAYTGAAVERIVSNLFKYFKNYGNPQKLYVLMPELIRKVGVIEDRGVFKPKIYRQYKQLGENMPFEPEHNLMAYPNSYPLQLLAYNYLNQVRYLEEYCFSNNIDLLWSSWDKSTNEFLDAYQHRYFFHVDLPTEDNDIWDGKCQPVIAKSFLNRINK